MKTLQEAVQDLQVQAMMEEQADASLEAFIAGEPGKAAASSALPLPSKAAAKAAREYPPYHPEALVQLFVDHPEWTHAQFADHFGYRSSWFASALVSQAVQAVVQRRRNEILNPLLKGDMQSWFQALTVQALGCLMTKLEDAKVDPEVVLKAAALGVKALGMGNANQALMPTMPTPQTLNNLAQDLTAGRMTPDIVEEAEETDSGASDSSIQHLLGE